MSKLVMIVEEDIQFVRSHFQLLRDEEYSVLVARNDSDIRGMLGRGIVDVIIIREQIKHELLVSLLTAIGTFRADAKLLMLTDDEASARQSFHVPIGHTLTVLPDMISAQRLGALVSELLVEITEERTLAGRQRSTEQVVANAATELSRLQQHVGMLVEENSHLKRQLLGEACQTDSNVRFDMPDADSGAVSMNSASLSKATGEIKPLGKWKQCLTSAKHQLHRPEFTQRWFWRREMFAGFLVLFCAWFAASHAPINDANDGIFCGVDEVGTWGDKAIHLIAYTIMVLVLLPTVACRRRSGQMEYVGLHAPLIVVMLTLGFIDEYTQVWFGRSFDIFDYTADLVGIGLGTTIYVFLGALPDKVRLEILRIYGEQDGQHASFPRQA